MKRRFGVVLIAIAVVLLAVVLVATMTQRAQVTGTPQPAVSGPASGSSKPTTPTPTIAAPGTPAATGTTAATSAEPSQEASTEAAPGGAAAGTEGCSWGAITAREFEVPARKIDEPVLTVGTEANGAVGAPPHNQRFAVGWWNAGPVIGTDQGHVILTAHTWTGGDIALGNILNDPTNGLHPGDVIRLSDGNRTVCYRYDHQIKINAASYDPSSKVWFDPTGAPLLTIMICWDYQGNDYWASRLIFFATPVR